MFYEVMPIKSVEATPWILQKHYAKRLPQISYAFGLYIEKQLCGVITYGQPASPFLCIGVCGEKNKEIVLELNRLCLQDKIKNGASFLISKSLNMLPKPSVVVSYADTAMGHIGYVYQATNFFFTGTTKERMDISAGDGKHSRHYKQSSKERSFRSAKHRYVYIVGTKAQKKQLLSELKYPIKPYPKGETNRYNSGGSVVTQPLLF